MVFEQRLSLRSSIELLKHIKFYKKYLFKSTKPNIAYLVCIIDFLQIYNFQKYFETKVKYFISERPSTVEAISSVPPDIYCGRFIDFVKKIVSEFE